MRCACVRQHCLLILPENIAYCKELERTDSISRINCKIITFYLEISRTLNQKVNERYKILHTSNLYVPHSILLVNIEI